MKNIFAIIGPSGSGKTTLGNYIKNVLEVPELISCTTREIRINAGERQGVPYYFYSTEEFEQLDLVQRSEYAGCYYGITKEEVESKWRYSNAVYVILNREGIEQFKTMYPKECKVIFIYCPMEEIERRMRERGDREEEIQKRLNYALQTNEYKNREVADFIITNLSIEESKKQMATIYKNMMQK